MRRLLILMLLVGCGDKDLATSDACNPLGGAACITPWPSAIYETDDKTTETKHRLDIPAGALPKNFDGIEVDPTLYNKQDGFSYAAPMIAAFETGVDASNLVAMNDIGASLTDASPTVVIDMSTGELVAHFAEIDAPAADTVASQALFIRPAQLLKPGTRYAVAIKKTLKAKGGGELPISEGFQAILDGETTSHPLLERVRGRYVDIFAALAMHGIQKNDLVVAWDFTTRSRTQVQFDLLHAREAALAIMGTNGSALTYSVDVDDVPGDTRLARHVSGSYDSPLLLTNGASPNGLDTKLMRDAQGNPVTDGLYRAPFTAIVPKCALTSSTPVPVIIYGHGLLGAAADQVTSGGMRGAAAEVCAIGIGTDMRGMSEIDVPNVALTLNDLNLRHLVFDVLVQGMINHVSLVQAVRGPMKDTLFAKEGGGSLIDPEKIYFYGISQGGIMGTTVCGIDPVIKRCVVQVGAINYSLLLERSRDWPTYRTTLVGAYQDPLVVALALNLMQQDWDRTEPVSVADVITGEGFPNTPPKQLFMQVGIGDDQVPNIGSLVQARTMGIPVITPSPVMPYGLEAATSAPSGIVYYDFGIGSTIPLTNEPPPANEVHGSIRNKSHTTDMMRHFYETGEILNMCTAPKGCDCTVAGACGDPI